MTLARTGVERDYRGDVINAHAPEMPTRFAKQLAQIVRGAVAIGMDRANAVRLAIRCARDSMPPLRLKIIDDLAEHPHSPTTEIRKRLDQPRNTVDRGLQALHLLDVVTVDEVEDEKTGVTRWYYSLADHIDPTALNPEGVPEMSLHISTDKKREGERGRRADTEETPLYPVTDISGTPGEQAPQPPPLVPPVTTTDGVNPDHGKGQEPTPPTRDSSGRVAAEKFAELRAGFLSEPPAAVLIDDAHHRTHGQRPSPNPYDPRLHRSDPGKKQPGRRARRRARR